MNSKHSRSFHDTSRRLLLIFTVLTQLPCQANGVVDIIRTLEASGILPQMTELSMYKVGDGGPLVDQGQGSRGLINGQFITNGEDASPKEFQHQAALLINTSVGFFQICGGVILSEHHVLTAAHCLPYLTGELNETFDHFIGVGMLDLSLGLNNPGSQILPVTRFYIHEDYDGDEPGYPNDIAVLYLNESIVENDYVSFAQLARPGMGSFAKSTCVVSGWGLTEDSYPNILQKGLQYIPTKRDCGNFWAVSKTARITKRHICGYYYPIQICSGDSGGPLTCSGNVVVGLVSWGLSNCSGCFPGVYTRVSFHHWWIRRALMR